MIRTRGIAAACVVALAAVALPATTSTAAGLETLSPVAARDARTTIEGELLVAVAHGPGVEQTLVSVRTEDGTVVALDSATVPDELASAAPGAEVAVTVAVPADVRAELRADGVDDAALADGSAEEEIAAALGDSDTPVAASAATVLSDAATAPSTPDIAAGNAIGALSSTTHEAYVVLIDDAAAAGEYTEASARASLDAGAAYWARETSGAMAGIAVKQVVTHPTANVCSTLAAGQIEQVWKDTAGYFPGVAFADNNARHLIVFVPTGCFNNADPRQSWTGMARINKDLASGGEVMIKMGDAHTVAHELGHNFGLGHSDLLREGREDGYYGLHSVQGLAMFNSMNYTTSFSAPALDVAYEWLLGTEAPSIIANGASGAPVTMQAVTGPSGVKAVGVTDSSKRMYFAEYRDGLGTDASAFYPHPSALAWQGIDSSPGVRVYELDYRFGWRVLTLTRPEGAVSHATLKAGQSLTTPDGRFVFNVASIGGGQATVSVASVASASSTSVSVARATHGKKTKVTVTVAGPVRPSGSVSVYDGSKKVATAILNANGVATAYLPASTKAGKRAIKADYVGGPGLSPSSASKKITVAKAKTKVKVTKAKNLKRGKKATLTFRLTGTSSTKPAGKVTVKVGSKTVSKAVKVKKVKGRWTAVVKTKSLPKGKVKVVYTPTKSAGKNLAKLTVTTSKRVR